MTNRHVRLIDLEVEILRETVLAWHVTQSTTDKAVWVPKSKCEVYPADRGAPFYVLTLPEWLASDKGLES